MLVAHEASPGAAAKCKEETAMWDLKPSWLPLMLSLLCSPLCRWGQLFCPPAHVPESGLPVLPEGTEPSCLPFILPLPVTAWSERREKEGYCVWVRLPGAKPTALHRRQPCGGEAGRPDRSTRTTGLRKVPDPHLTLRHRDALGVFILPGLLWVSFIFLKKNYEFIFKYMSHENTLEMG